MDHVIDWVIAQGVPADAATTYVTNMFAAVCQEACGMDKEGVHHMATVSTPGGINMQALELLDAAGAFTAWQQTLDLLWSARLSAFSKVERSTHMEHTVVLIHPTIIKLVLIISKNAARS